LLIYNWKYLTMEIKEYQKYWENKLIKYTNSSKNTALPKSSLTIIEEWGLPTFKGWIFNFDCLKSKLKSITIDKKSYFVFGNNFETSLTFDKEGKIWSFMQDEEEDENLFVNSSLQNFATFLCFFHDYWKKVRAFEKEEKK
jgi:hypothetical protein